MNTIEEQVMYCVDQHRKAFTDWKEGSIDKYWIDENDSAVICIKYNSGKWWHYRINSRDKTVIWW